MKVRTKSYTKLCHANVGQVIKLGMRVNSPTEDYIEDGPAYMVCARGQGRPARVGMSQGLYDDNRQLFLIDLTKGIEVPMPNLSSKIFICATAELLVSDEVIPLQDL